MKIGDKVRFLSEVGGGKVSGFQGKNTVLVEDEDGFEIPMPLSEVIVVETDDYNMAKANTGAASKPEVKENPSLLKEQEPEEVEVEPCDMPITFKAKPMERRGGDELNLSLCFVPVDVKRISTTNLKAYFVNESNYYMQVLLLANEGAGYYMMFNATVAPNSKLVIDEFERTELNTLEHLCLQTMAWKEDKLYAVKPTMTTEVKLDCTKFYKLHTFQPTPFFETPCWEIPIIRDDKSVRSLMVDATELQEAMTSTASTAQKPAQVQTAAGGRDKSKPAAKDPIVVDLHIDQLIDNTNGLNNADMLEAQMKEFRRVMDENIRHTGRKIVFIHGKGNGVLRKSLLQELKYRYKHCTSQDASFREYGYGATQVTIHSK